MAKKPHFRRYRPNEHNDIKAALALVALVLFLCGVLWMIGYAE